MELPSQRRSRSPKRAALFQESYSCFSVACVDKPQLENGDKVVLPQSALHQISVLGLPYPLLFRVTNTDKEEEISRKRRAEKHNTSTLNTTRKRKLQFCGVMEFSAPEGKAFLPFWMMKNLSLNEGDTATLRSCRELKRGTYCRFQPHSSAFLDVAATVGPKKLLENTFSMFSALTMRQTVMLEWQGVQYYLDVIELKPERAVSLYGHVDLVVDFAPPLDIKSTILNTGITYVFSS